MALADAIHDPTKKPAIIADCCKLIDDEVHDKGGLTGLAVKAGYAAVKGIKPGFIAHVVEELMPEFAAKLDPIWEEAGKTPDPVGVFTSQKARVADALLSVTDRRAKDAKSNLVRGTYGKLRPSAKKNVEEATLRLGRLLQKYAG